MHSDTENSSPLIHAVNSVWEVAEKTKSQFGQDGPILLTGANSHHNPVTLSSKSSVTRKSSFLSSVMQVADKHASTALRPRSAPSRSSFNAISTSLQSEVSEVAQGFTREKQLSETDKKQKRKANIEESARAAFCYSAKRQSLKTMSLPRDHKTEMCSATWSTSRGQDSENTLSSDLMEDSPSGPCLDERSMSNTGISSLHTDGVFMVDEIFDEIERIGVSNPDVVDVGGCGHDTVKSVTGEISSYDHCDSKDGDAIEEKDIFVSIEEPQSVSGGDQKVARLDLLQVNNSARAMNEVRHRAASFSNKRNCFVVMLIRNCVFNMLCSLMN